MSSAFCASSKEPLIERSQAKLSLGSEGRTVDNARLDDYVWNYKRP